MASTGLLLHLGHVRTYAVVRVGGELDVTGLSALADAIARARDLGERVVVDLRPLEFMDSGGLRLFAAAQRQAVLEGTHFHLVAGPDPVQSVFALTGTRDAFSWIAPEQLEG